MLIILGLAVNTAITLHLSQKAIHVEYLRQVSTRKPKKLGD